MQQPTSISVSPSPTLEKAPSLEPTLTPVFLPTLSASEAQNLISDLMANNAGCQLPCWWGFIPGESSWQSVEAFLQTVQAQISSSTNSQGDQSYEVHIPAPDPKYTDPIRQSYQVHKGIVEWIETPSILNAPPYYLPNVLIAYGEPDEIWISAQAYAPLINPFRIVLFYPNYGMMVMYSEDAIQQGEMLRECPKSLSGSALAAWPEDFELTFADAVNRSRQFQFETPFRTLEESTGMSVTTFYSSFKDPESVLCLQTPAILWPVPN